MRLWVLMLLSAVSLCAQAATVQEFTKGMQHQSGLFDLYYQPKDGSIYVLVRKTAQPFILQTSLPRGLGSNDIGLDRGQLGETRLVQFERFGDKLLLKQLNTYYQARSSNAAEQQSVQEAFASSVLAGLPIVAEQNGQLLVNYTAFLLSDQHQIAERLQSMQQGNYQVDPNRSGVYLPRSKSFVKNTELEALVTYAGSGAGNYVRQVAPTPNALTVHLHHSLVALPDNHYQPREFHPYSGYWKVEYQDYASPITEGLTTRLLPRHRLAKKQPNAAQSEAVNPIVYYLDPGVPEPVRTALKEGALWWDQAFSRLGYKNAFQVKDLPKDADPMDIRYNVIQWVHRASRGWSYGFGVVDPRTGEIIKGHVTLGSLRVRQDFLIATGLTGPYQGRNANEIAAEQALALARIRQLAAHEVGHTFGLIHNFAGSANSNSTVMDYPHPWVSLEGKRIDISQPYREGLGEWDHFAIAYGYSDGDDDAAKAARLELVRLAKAKGLQYMADEDARPAGSVSPVGHLWDSGNDPLAELQRLSKVRQQAFQQFGLNNIAAGQPLSSLQEALVPIYLLHRYQVEAVAKTIGGAFYHYELKGEQPTPSGVKMVDSAQQIKALEALLSTVDSSYLLLPPTLLQLITPKAYGDSNGRESFTGRTGLAFDPLSAAEAAAAHSVGLLLNSERLNRLHQQQLLATVLDTLLVHTLKTVPKGNQAADLIGQRVAHVSFYFLMTRLMDKQVSPEARALLRSKLAELDILLGRDPTNANALMLHQQWQLYLQNGQWQPLFQPLDLPPGAPI